MGLAGVDAEAGAGLEAVRLPAQHQLGRPLQYVAEFFAFVGLDLFRAAAGRQGDQDGLHPVFLRHRHQPDHPDPERFVHLFEHIVLGEDELLLGGAGKEFFQCGAQGFQHVRQRGDRGGGLVPLHLGDKALGQLTPVRHFFLGEVALDPQLFEFLADVLGSHV